MILENRCWIYSFILINFNEKLLKKKIEFSSGKQRNNCNEIQIDMIEYTCIIAREKKHSFPFFLEKFYGYVLL